ncbi:MAG: HlyD family efflux transporter periplasmic adaptor subunit [Anaerovoracaceae bacterium]
MAEQINEQKKKKKVRKLKHPLRLFILIYIIAVAALIGIVYFFPWVSDQMADVMTVEYGTLDNSQKCDVYFVKYEAVFFADESGKVGYSYAEGDMARTSSDVISISKSSADNNTDYDVFEENMGNFLNGETLLQSLSSKTKQKLLESLSDQKSSAGSEAEKLMIQNAIDDVSRNSSSSSQSESDSNDSSANLSSAGISGNYSVETSGVVSYKLDGYEYALSPYTMEYLDKSKVSSISDKSSDVFTGVTTKNKPVFKIVDNREWYAVTWVSSDDASKFEEDGTITLELDDGDESGTVEKIVQQGDDYLIIMKFTSYFSGVASARKESCKIVTSDQKGLIVKNDFITEKDGQSGVYVVDVAGDTTFTPVKILATDGTYSLAASGSFVDDSGNTVNTINVYDEIKKVD